MESFRVAQVKDLRPSGPSHIVTSGTSFFSQPQAFGLAVGHGVKQLALLRPDVGLLPFFLLSSPQGDLERVATDWVGGLSPVYVCM